MAAGASEAQPLEDAVRTFAEAVAASFHSSITTKPEDRLNDPVRALLAAYGQSGNLDVASHQQVKEEGVGWPDLGVSVRGLLCGHIELKAPDVSARPESYPADGSNGRQWKRYQALPNLIYTNGSEWSLYHGRKRARRVRIADDIRDGANSLNYDKLPELRKLFHEFLN